MKTTPAGLSEDNTHSNHIDVYSKTSNRNGLSGLLETLLRRFRIAGYIVAIIPIYALGCIVMGISTVPGIYLFNFLYESTLSLPQFFHFAAIGFGIVSAYFAYGFTLILVVPLVNFLLPLRIKPFRGNYFSLESVPWFVHNALTYMVRYTFLEFITPTPFNILFYRLMGMKIGRNVHLNTTKISDPALITIEDNVTIGGSVTLIAHYASKGYLVVSPTRIGKGATIGLGAKVFGNVEIGAGAKVAPGEVVLPKTRIPDAPTRKKEKSLRSQIEDLDEFNPN